MKLSAYEQPSLLSNSVICHLARKCFILGLPLIFYSLKP